MSIYSLSIRTMGICTHFANGVVAGVPHRVVLPDATNLVTGFLTVENVPAPREVAYYLVPHFPALAVNNDTDLTIPGLLSNGEILAGVRLQVSNCVTSQITYDDEKTPRLTTYEPAYTFSSDVVLHGRAACYLDVYGGTVDWVPPPTPDGAGAIVIEMETAGPPELIVTPLRPSPGLVQKVHRLPLAKEGGPRNVTLSVMNLEVAQERCAEEMHGAFDYLLHFLTARGGIPRSIASATPGMPPDPKSVTPDRLAEALRELADLLVQRDESGKRTPALEIDLTASCAPSLYP